MNPVRFGIVGVGNMGRFHADLLAQGKVERATLTALAARSSEKLSSYEGVEQFSDPSRLIHSPNVDVVLVATPHPTHVPLGLETFRAGKHLMVEKPISSHKADAERLIAGHREHPDLVFGAMFQLRTEPRYRRIKSLIDSGELGRITRVNWIVTDWFRTETYFASGGWRATWKEEGGGVLLNQALHNLDTLQWLCGMPTKVRGFCQLGRYHAIEVEDQVTAFLEYANGATGVFITSTGEAPGSNRLEICGTRGKVTLENDKLTFVRNEIPMDEFSRTTKSGFGKPEIWEASIPIKNAQTPHALILKNFVDAILDKIPLLVPGEEGIYSVELANAILFSSLEERSVELPLDSAAYEKKLNELIANSTLKKTVTTSGTADFADSFHR
jgi:predicted dehydrogenase